MKKQFPNDECEINWGFPKEGEKKGGPRQIKMGNKVLYEQDKFGTEGKWHEDVDDSMDF